MSNEGVSLEVDSILEEASNRARKLTDTGEPQFMEGLRRLSDSLESEARLNPIGRMIARERAILSTVNRLNYLEDRRQNPTIADEKIVAACRCRHAPNRLNHSARHPGSGPAESSATDLGNDVPLAAAGTGNLRY